jgi:hypothetical protein
MDPTSGIRKLGFRKWYERELIKGHAALVTCFLCGLTVAALVEQVKLVDFGVRPMSMLVIVFGAGLLALTSWRSYFTTLQRAERYGASSTCPKCRAYARFKVVAAGADHTAEPDDPAGEELEAPWLRVECRKCGTAWRMPE